MYYSVSIIIRLKNQNNHLFFENLIHEASSECNNISIYEDYELEGINNYIKKNNKIIIVEFEGENDVCNFISFIKTIKELDIEYIYYENSILYGSKKYLNSIDKNLCDKKNLETLIETNKKNDKFKKIYNTLFN